MKGREVIKDIMEKKGISNATLAHRMGVSIPTMWDRVNSKKAKDIPLSTLSAMLRQLDYKIVIVPSSKQVKSDEYVVDVDTQSDGGAVVPIEIEPVKPIETKTKKIEKPVEKGTKIHLTPTYNLDELLGK